jgi:hypothetical protein
MWRIGGMLKNKIVWIESSVLLAISILCLLEGYHLIIHKVPGAIYDLIGPGYYVLFLGTAMGSTGVAHLIINCGKPLVLKAATVKRDMKVKMILTVGACAAYILLIDAVGYLLSTVVFNLMAFRVAGVKKWPLLLILSLGIATFYYVVFAHYCEIVFPEGIFF